MGAAEAFATLNERQRAAAQAGAAPLLIIAGAGTGKTNTLAHRVAHLVLEGAAPERILLLTFTRRAALEMTRRASRIVAEAHKSVRLPWSGTFHAVANRLIRRHCAAVGLSESFSVLDRGDAADLMDVARHELGFSKTEKRFPRKDTCVAIYSHRVNTQGSLAATLKEAFPWCVEWEEELKKLFKGYVERKLANQALDYDDLLLYWHAMMEDEALANDIGARFDHVLVDEYQDTNVLQAEILRRLRPTGAGLTVVGDDAQSIYSFRAASVDNILGFSTQYQETKTVVLEENYRSTQPVLDAATLHAMQELVRRVPVSKGLISAAVSLTRMTRPADAEAPGFVKEFVEWGAGPRASQYLVLGAKAKAAMDGRPMADLDDVKAVAPFVLRHRVVTNFAAEAADRSSADIVGELVGGSGWLVRRG